ncbi:RNA-guided pseudouridylation complex pseudouridine synthase subunit Cbf5 [Candidatus Woesearchaeota archaeon]|nr:RNA-guided pseudouridylation complex pseudouridine synthase subunit Cbf5 [Candidatus Woesearchaeota archaeon]
MKEILTNIEAETDPSLGCNPEERKTEDILSYGIINIDKPKGPTSHQVSDMVKRILSLKKAGHSGTLDPAVTGVLPIALGRATRVIHAILKSGKEYVGIMHLHKEVDEKTLRDVCKKFIGTITQLPPIKSAVKRQERKRKIYYFDILEIQGQDILFRTGVQAGTYIRKLIHDMGKELKVGAHMAELRRTKAGPFEEDTLTTLQNLTDALHYYKENKDEKQLREIILPVESAVEHLPKVWVLDSTVDTLCHGANLNIPGISKLNKIKEKELVAVMTLKDELIGIGTASLSSKDILKKEKGLAVDIQKVFMLPDTYKKDEI